MCIHKHTLCYTIKKYLIHTYLFGSVCFEEILHIDGSPCNEWVLYVTGTNTYGGKSSLGRVFCKPTRRRIKRHLQHTHTHTLYLVN